MMKIQGQYTFEGPRDVVWPLIFDPSTLVTLIPGCKILDQTSEGEYRGQMQVMIPAVGGTYDIVVTLTALEPPERCCMDGEVTGSTGVIKGKAQFILRELQAKTELHYDASATISGALGTLSIRLISGVVKALLDQGLAKLNQQVAARVLISGGGTGHH